MLMAWKQMKRPVIFKDTMTHFKEQTHLGLIFKDLETKRLIRTKVFNNLTYQFKKTINMTIWITI